MNHTYMYAHVRGAATYKNIHYNFHYPNSCVKKYSDVSEFVWISWIWTGFDWICLFEFVLFL